MFTVDELLEITQHPDFRDDFAIVQESLARTRLKQPSVFLNGAQKRLSYFVESVLASAPMWSNGAGDGVCRQAAEIAEMLANRFSFAIDDKRMRLRAALLYELARLPTLSSSVIQQKDFGPLIQDLFFRTGAFRELLPTLELPRPKQFEQSDKSLIESALQEDALRLLYFEQGESDSVPSTVSSLIAEIASSVSLEMSATELTAFDRVINDRIASSTKSVVDDDLFASLRTIRFPAELWTTQIEAIKGGLLDSKTQSWGFAAPTGSGKTFLCRALILKTLEQFPGKSILYLVPSRALVHEVSTTLENTFRDTEFGITAITPQLVELSEEESTLLEDTSVAVMTPEKADLLLRLGMEFIKNASLVIVDEAHHIEAGTRGVLLELYLWRLRKMLPIDTRVVFLSAVAPNISELAAWMGTNHGSVTSEKRSTRMRVGVYRVSGTGKNRSGVIEYSDGISIRIFDKGVDSGLKRGLVQLAHKLSSAGPVLVVTKGKGEAEALAREMYKWLNTQNALNELSPEQKGSEFFLRLDSRLEREMYSTIEMRTLLPFRIAYHHAGLPPRVRLAVEEAIRNHLIDYVFATTTLAEGVNFPFSTVIVQTLALREPPQKGFGTRYHLVTPRSFWNIAGRAGRPGFDREGQAILFEPSLGLERVNAVLAPYLNPSLNAIEPVRSALNANLTEISTLVSQHEISWHDLEREVLPQNVPKNIQGAVNLFRVGIIHAKAAGLTASPEEILEGTFASKQLDNNQRDLMLRFLGSQSQVVNQFLDSSKALPIKLIAELGISIETLSLLTEYVSNLEDWRIERFGELLFGGRLNLNQCRYVVGPVAKRMAELEGPTLGGIYSEVIVNWLAGIPLETVRARSQSLGGRLEDLISVIYSRIQYLLPWGLYAMDSIVEEEAKRRHIDYENEILSLAQLADAGVPSFDALRLVHLDFERVDATRLAYAYQRRGGLRLGVDVVGWLRRQPIAQIHQSLKGADNRRIDYDLPTLLENLRLPEDRLAT
jgi:superfamily II DNA/RNA helicase